MKFDIVRAWKDEAYRLSLSDEQRDMLPANPAGLELVDADLESIYGGGGSSHESSLALVTCQLNVFTLNVNVLAVPVNILDGASNNCEQNH